ncbi:hypothetical protein PUN28_020201 [Cardiocondyla obscurior]|uniref:Uncharacterized protein n=1 Tax=Cardiocondyla obscurior TaxID=286306 RepID=A0AAW2E5N2_9HYME
MAEQDILDIFGDSLSDLSDEEAGPQQVPAKKTDPPDPKRDVPRVGSSIQRSDQAQRRHTQWLSEPPPMRRPGRRPPSGPTAGRRTRDAVTTATEKLEARAAGRPPPRPRAPTAPVLPGPRPQRPGPAVPHPGPLPVGPQPRGPPPFGPPPFGPPPLGLRQWGPTTVSATPVRATSDQTSSATTRAEDSAVGAGTTDNVRGRKLRGNNAQQPARIRGPVHQGQTTDGRDRGRPGVRGLEKPKIPGTNGQ